MSSIFDDKLEFEQKDYQIPKLNPSVEYILQTINELQIFENKKGDNFSDVSREVLEVGLEPPYFNTFRALCEIQQIFFKVNYWFVMKAFISIIKIN
jgi:hypothetical protein|tara:strand:+ start:608 stop:895 length:288 start_codon:yes stop_codon:yes gene_type:complete